MKFKETSFIKEVFIRWKAESPIFFKKVKSYAITIGVANAGVLAMDKYFDLQNSYHVSPVLFTACGYVIAICGGLGIGAKLTKK